MTFGATKMSDLDERDTSTELYISADCTTVVLANDSLEAYIKQQFSYCLEHHRLHIQQTLASKAESLLKSGRWAGASCQQLLMICFIQSGQSSGMGKRAPSLATATITRYGFISPHGISPVASSHTMTPKLYTSHFSLRTPVSRKTSGAIHGTAPKEPASSLSFAPPLVAIPRSATFAWSWSVISTFDEVRSLWISGGCISCKWFIAFAISEANFHCICGESFPCRRRKSHSEPLPASSRTKAGGH